jgi:hypothetical protein
VTQHCKSVVESAASPEAPVAARSAAARLVGSFRAKVYLMIHCGLS